jgi:hypothetical protein
MLSLWSHRFDIVLAGRYHLEQTAGLERDIARFLQDLNIQVRAGNMKLFGHISDDLRSFKLDIVLHNPSIHGALQPVHQINLQINFDLCLVFKSKFSAFNGFKAFGSRAASYQFADLFTMREAT